MSIISIIITIIITGSTSIIIILNTVQMAAVCGSVLSGGWQVCMSIIIVIITIRRRECLSECGSVRGGGVGPPPSREREQNSGRGPPGRVCM